MSSLPSGCDFVTSLLSSLQRPHTSPFSSRITMTRHPPSQQGNRIICPMGDPSFRTHCGEKGMVEKIDNIEKFETTNC